MGASPEHSQRRLIVAPAEPAAADKTGIALSFHGRTSDSDSLDRGSNPWGATKTTSQTIPECPQSQRISRFAGYLAFVYVLGHTLTFRGNWGQDWG